jgi:AraC-like DNA-binding protein
MKTKIDIPDLNFILLSVGHACHNADWNFKNINSPFSRIHYVEKGTAKIIRDNESYILKPNYLYLTPAYSKHGYICDDILNLYYIHIYENTGLNMSIFDQFDLPVETEANPIDLLLIKRLMEINPNRDLKIYDPYIYDNVPTLLKDIKQDNSKSFHLKMETQAILQSLFSRFLVHIPNKMKDMDNHIHKALIYIHKNLDKPISLQELADTSCLNKDYFIHLFKKEMKCTPIQYVIQKKIEKAQLMLIIKNISIKEAAYSISIDSPSYFNRLFKKVTGRSPSTWIKENRNN